MMSPMPLMMVGRDCTRHVSLLTSSPLPASTTVSVNVIKGKLWDEESEFVGTKDKDSFRQYDNACERVKAFYKEQHGEYCSSAMPP